MQIQDKLRALIIDIRNARDLGANLQRFKALINTHQADILEKTSLRWLVSICDTLVDHGDEIEKHNAAIISMFVNMLRYSETIKYISGPINEDRLALTRAARVELYDGLSTFAIDKQDTYLNLMKRTQKLLFSTPFLFALFREILHRLHGGENAITYVRNISAMPERYFPEDASDLTDNYGNK